MTPARRTRNRPQESSGSSPHPPLGVDPRIPMTGIPPGGPLGAPTYWPGLESGPVATELSIQRPMFTDRIRERFALRAALVIVLVQLEMPWVAAGQTGAHRHPALRRCLLPPDGAVLPHRGFQRRFSRVDSISFTAVEAEPGRERAFVRPLVEVIDAFHATTSSTERTCNGKWIQR